MATPGGQNVNLTPVYIEDRQNLLREQVAYSSSIDMSVDHNSKFNEVISLAGNQGNPAAAHVEEFIAEFSKGKGGNALGLHDQLVGLFRGVMSENESLAMGNADLARQNAKLVEYVKEFQSWQTNVFWQLDKYRTQQSELESLRIKCRDFQANEANFLRQIEDQRIRIGQEQSRSASLQLEVDTLKAKLIDLTNQNQYLNSQVVEQQSRITDLERRLIELDQLRAIKQQLELDIKVRTDEFNIKYRNLENVNQSLSIEIKRLNELLIDFYKIKSERDEMAIHFKEENDRVLAKAKATIAQGFSEHKIKAPETVIRAKTGEALQNSFYSGRGVDMNVSRQFNQYGNNSGNANKQATIVETVVVDEPLFQNQATNFSYNTTNV